MTTILPWYPAQLCPLGVSIVTSAESGPGPRVAAVAQDGAVVTLSLDDGSSLEYAFDQCVRVDVASGRVAAGNDTPMPSPADIVRVRVLHMYETCERHTFLVELTTDEGFTITPSSFATGSIYTEGKGLSKHEARDRALIEAHVWGDLLRLPVDAFTQDGETHEPSMTFDTYADERLQRIEDAAKASGRETA